MSQKLLDLFKETAEQTGVSEQVVEAVVNELWYGIRNQVAKSQGNNILLHYLGTFEIPKGSIDKYIEVFEKSYQLGNIDKRKYEKGILNLKNIKDQNES